jgi:coenzyme F420-reducing hydrogenase delta subunit
MCNPPLIHLKLTPMPTLFKENITQKQIALPRPAFSSLGLVIPFQPSMWNEKSINEVLDYALEIVQTKLKERYSIECTHKVLGRLKKVFARLNLNTHRKSLAIILTNEEEKVIHLDFPVRPVVFFSNAVSMLDLAANIEREPGFYFLVLNNNRLRSYEFYNNKLNKVYEQNDEKNVDHLLEKASGIIELLNSKNEKPVFVTGSPELVEGFYKSSSFPQIIFKKLHQGVAFSDDVMKFLTAEISGKWSYWQSKFLTGRILIDQKAGSLISKTDAVLQALRKKEDGLLLIDKRLKKQLYNCITGNAIINTTAELTNLVENFLVRGNRIEITETGLLKDMGGIVLLRNNLPAATGKLSYINHREVCGEGLLF